MLIQELQQKAKEKKSIGKRDVSFRFYQQCVTEFGSFNAAKENAGLVIARRSPCIQLTNKQKEKTKTLTKIISYVTFDGHLSKDLKTIYVSSNNIQELLIFEHWMIKQFNITAKKIDKTNNKYNNYRIWFFNREVANFLYKVGTPKGDKALISFRIPEWISKNKEFAREYIKIAYLCEGCNKEYDRPNPRISFSQNKEEKLIKEGVVFLDKIKWLLRKFGINTTTVKIRTGTIRKDGTITKTLRFSILSKDNSKFYSEIGWLK